MASTPTSIPVEIIYAPSRGMSLRNRILVAWALIRNQDVTYRILKSDDGQGTIVCEVNGRAARR